MFYYVSKQMSIMMIVQLSISVINKIEKHGQSSSNNFFMVDYYKKNVSIILYYTYSNIKNGDSLC